MLVVHGLIDHVESSLADLKYMSVSGVSVCSDASQAALVILSVVCAI